MLSRHSSIFILFSLLIFFQNFSFASLYNRKFQVDEKSRLSHAKEIMGVKYKSSSVSKLEGEKFIHLYLHDVVQQGLPMEFKLQSKKIVETLISESKKHKIDPIFLVSIIKTESSFNPNARGTSGEIGLMQLLPATAKDIAFQISLPWKGHKTLENPINNIKIGAAYISQLRDLFERKPLRYISAYNSGPGRILKIEEGDKVPKFYKSKVLRNYESFYNQMASFRAPKDLAVN